MATKKSTRTKSTARRGAAPGPKRRLTVEVQGSRVTVRIPPTGGVTPFEAPIVLEQARMLMMQTLERVQAEG